MHCNLRKKLRESPSVLILGGKEGNATQKDNVVVFQQLDRPSGARA